MQAGNTKFWCSSFQFDTTHRDGGSQKARMHRRIAEIRPGFWEWRKLIASQLSQVCYHPCLQIPIDMPFPVPRRRVSSKWGFPRHDKTFLASMLLCISRLKWLKDICVRMHECVCIYTWSIDRVHAHNTHASMHTVQYRTVMIWILIWYSTVQYVPPLSVFFFTKSEYHVLIPQSSVSPWRKPNHLLRIKR